MLIDGLNLAEGSSAQNFTISSGSSFPLIAAEGEAFYRNDGANEGLYLYDGASWIQAGGGTSFDPSVPQSITGLFTFTQPISGVSPISASDLTTKQYVDNLATGLDVKLSVKVSTTANIALSGTQTIDGVSVLAGDRVLVKDQTAGAQNGIYVVSAGAWARSADADNSPVGEVTSGLFTLVTSGTTNANKGFVLTTDDPITLGSTALVFTQFSGGASAPALTTTQIGFGSGTNVLSGSTKFTWLDTTSTITLGINGVSTTESAITTMAGTTPLPNSPNLTISTGASGSGQYAGSLTLKGGVGTGGGGAGGHVIISGGAGGWSSGNVSISTGGGATGTQGYLNFMTSASGAVVERLRILANGAWSVGTGGAATGASGQVLTSTGGTTAPTWQAQAVSSVAGRTGAVTLTVADIPDAQPKTLSLVSQSADYTCVLADSGKVILHPAADVTARTFTIPANASVPYPIGTVITFINQNASGVISIAITTDVMRLAGAGTVGTRSLAANGLATATKITSAEWIISGVGLT